MLHRNRARVWMMRVALVTAAAVVIPACGGGGGGAPAVVPFAITTSSVPAGVVGVAYSQTLTTQSASGTVVWALLAGGLPAGLTLNAATGVISGTPTGSANFSSAKIRATDASGVISDTVLMFTVTGGAPAALALTTTSPLPGGNQNAYYTFGFSASGGAPGYTWTITSGAQPTGLVLNPANGGLTGVPTATGIFNFTVKVTDAALATSSVAFQLTIAPPLTNTTTTLADGTVGAAYSHSLTGSGGTAPRLFTVTSGTLPAGLSLNSATGDITGTPTTAGSSSFNIHVVDFAGSQVDVGLSILINVAPTVVTASLPASTQGLAYNQTLTGTGGTAPLSWSVSSGSLPTGLSLSSAGVITGTSSVANTFTFTAFITDAAGGTGSRSLQIVINPVVAVTNPSLVGWTLNRPSYSQTLTATGGTGAHTWTITGGTLPTGLSLNASTGAITGTPTVVGTSNFTAVATDTLGATGSKALSIVINNLPSITTSTIPDWTASLAYTSTPIVVLNGTAPFGYSISGGALPAGMSLDPSTGLVSGTPTATGPFSFTVQVVDAAGASTTRAVTFTVNAVNSITTASPLAQWTQNKSGYSASLASTGGTGAKTFSVASGLPVGLSISTAGVISGTPTDVPNTYSFLVTVTDSVGATASKSFDITVNAPLVITTTSPITAWTRNQPGYSVTMAATGGTSTKTWSNPAGGTGLPAGLTLSPAGVLSGTPGATGTFTFNVQVTDTVLATAPAPVLLSLTINAPLAITTTSPVSPWTLGQGGYSATLVATGGTSTKTWSTPAGGTGLPAGMTVSSAGILGGTPGASGVFTFNVQVTDITLATAPAPVLLSITINPVPSISSTSPLAAWTQDLVGYSQSVSAGGGTGTLTWSNPGGGMPPGLALDTSTGAITGKPTGAGTYNPIFKVADTTGALSAGIQLTIVINQPLVITTASLAAWDKDLVGYSQTLAATGGTGTRTWAVASGSLPSGLFLNTATGVITGTPDTVSSPPMTLKVTDQLGATTAVNPSLPITINAPPSVSSTSPLAAWTKDKSGYSQTLTSSGGTGGVTWSVSTGSLPSGLTLNPSTGAITGTPDTAAPITFGVKAKDSLNVFSPEQSLSITVNPALSITTPTPIAPWTRNFGGYSQQLNASGGTGSQSWSIILGGLPTGLSLSGSGLITGTPTSAAGPYGFTAQVQDSVGATTTLVMAMTLNPALSISNGFPLASWTQGKSGYSQTMIGSGGTGSTSFSVFPGPLPPGLNIAANGAITGNPTTPGTYNFTVVLTDSIGATGTLGEQILINPPLNITTGPLATWTQGVSGYNQVVAASGGTGTQTFTLFGGSLPPSLSLATDGTISGTPSAAGNFNFTVQVADSVGATNQKVLGITINPPVAITTTSPLPDGAQSIFYNTVFSASGGTGGITWSTTTTPPNPVPGLTLSGNTLSGTPTTGGTFPFSLKATDSLGSTVTVPMSLFVLAPLTVTTTDPLAAATAGSAYPAPPLGATGGKTAYSWSKVAGTLPGGISFDSAGNWSGTPPLADNNGIYNFTVRVTDADGRTADKPLSITLTGGTAAAISQSPTTLPDATQGAAYDRSITATGGTPGYTWTSATFSPAGSGLTLQTNGHVTGTAGTPGTYSVSSQVTDSLLATNTVSISVTINNPLVITTSNPFGDWTVTPSSPYNKSLARSGGSTPFSWAIASGALPPGISLNTATGALTGTATAAGTYAFTAQVTDNAGAVDTKGLQIQINSSVTVGNFSPMAQWDLNFPGYNQSLFANNGTAPFTWSITGGALPPGLTLTAGTISGTPTLASSGPADFTFTAQVIDAAGSVDSKSLSIFINQPLQITTGSSLPGGTENVAYNQPVNASGGSGGYLFSKTGGTLPAGMSFTGGSFVGTPNPGTSATYNPQITVTDNIGATSVRTFTLIVTNSPGVLTSTPGNAGTNVNLDANLVITFNMTMVKAEVESRFSLAPLSGSPVHKFFWDTPGVNPNGNTLTVAIDTAAPFGVISGDDLLTENTLYTWSISSGAHSASALVMPAQSGTFTTIPDGTAPAISSITPDPRAGILSNVTGFTIVFSEAMNTSGSNGNVQVQLESQTLSYNAQAGAGGPPMSVQWTNSTTLAIGFSSALPDNTGYRLSIQQAQDAAGNYMNSGGEFSILTSGALSGAPFVTGTFPPDTATGVSRDAGIFIGVSEPLSPNVLSLLSITGTTTPVTLRYELGKNDGPQGIQVTPKKAWPASTLITVSIPAGVTNASGVALPPFSFSFTTGTTGVGTSPIIIDAASSSIKNGMGDIGTDNGIQGELVFVDSVSGNRVYLDATTLTNSAISVKDSNGIPAKMVVVNALSNGGGGEDPARGLQLSNRFGQGVGSLAQGMTYTLTLNSSITGSAGQTYAGDTYTFSTTPDSNTLPRATASFNDFNASTGPGPSRFLDVKVDLNGGSSIFGGLTAANASAGNTDYSTNNFIPGWITGGASVAISGFSTHPSNNGTFTVVSVTPGSPTIIRVNNPSGISESSGSGQMGAPYSIVLADITGGTNTFSAPLPQSNNNNYQYSSNSDETTITTSGDHLFQFTVSDGVPSHTLLVNKSSYFFTGTDMTALTLTPTAPSGGLLPTFTWSGTAPASITALFIQVKDVTDSNNKFVVGGWIIPPSSTSFTEPDNFPLVAGHNYQWGLGFLHSGDNTIRDQNGGNGQLNPVSFSR